MKGPGLGLKLLLLSCGLLIVPWFTLRQLIEIEQLLIEGQARAQLLTAEGISTLLNGREDLFRDLPLPPESFASLFLTPLETAIRLDGDESDWSSVTDVQNFGVNAAGQLVDGGFALRLGVRGNFLYGLLTINDDHLVMRDQRVLRLDGADHLRLSLITGGVERHLILTLLGEGPITAYWTDEAWRYAAGAPERRVQGEARSTAQGVRVEFRLPMKLLGKEPLFSLAYADVDERNAPALAHLTQTLPNASELGYNLVVLRSPEVRSIIEGMVYAGARILVIDAHKQVRAEAGSYSGRPADQMELPAVSSLDRFLTPVLPWVRSVMDVLPIDYHGHATSSSVAADRAIESSLAGTPVTLRRELKTGEEIIMAAYPIVDQDDVIGAVVLEQNTDAILAIQRQTLERVFAVSFLSLLLVMVALMAFSVRLTWRIRSLGQEATNAIDQDGRLRTSSLTAQTNTGDEIGELARSVSNMLSKLHQHTRFLESVPRTLRHELNNPLNSLSTSLQNLEQEYPDVADSRYLESAKRGLLRIGGIVQHLADAASLEESLKSEDFERVDLTDLVRNYVSNYQLANAKVQFILEGISEPAFAMVSDFRIEQMLDKIIDNAMDFHTPGTPIRIQLDLLRDQVQLRVQNQGPPIAPELQGNLFDSMVSRRNLGQEGVHFGLGLFVVRVIAQHHGGSVSAANLPNDEGVAVTVRLPRSNVVRARQRGRLAGGAHSNGERR